jgi:hypothetical protein
MRQIVEALKKEVRESMTRAQAMRSYESGQGNGWLEAKELGLAVDEIDDFAHMAGLEDFTDDEMRNLLGMEPPSPKAWKWFHDVRKGKKHEAVELSPDQKRELDIVQKHHGVKKHKQNPFVDGPGYGGKFVVCFKTANNDSEPLFWTGSGFKNMARVSTEPQYFDSKSAAEQLVRTKLLDFIRKDRDQGHLIIGW